ncbi:hypothetical protein SUGI_0419590 [Cryptomeria japonica]|nr:hypothetical protein SUGI_0419590 [Cryptomeria japonica]
MYRVEAAGAICAASGTEKSSADLLLVETRDFLEPWHNLYESTVTSGSPFERVHGMKIWDYANLHPHFRTFVYDAMASNSALLMDAIAINSAVLMMQPHHRTTISMLMQKCPHICSINFDLPLLPKTFLVWIHYSSC